MASFGSQKFGDNRLCALTYDTAGAQETINVPYLRGGMTIQLNPTGGSARVEGSNDGVNWEAWANGDVSITTMGKASPIRYLRVVHVTATASSIIVWGY